MVHDASRSDFLLNCLLLEMEKDKDRLDRLVFENNFWIVRPDITMPLAGIHRESYIHISGLLDLIQAID